MDINTYDTEEELINYLVNKPYKYLTYVIATQKFLTNYKIITSDIVQLVDSDVK